MILDIVIRVFNNEKNILNYYNKIEEELKNIKHRYVFVDDSSTDNSLDILKDIQKDNESKVRIISLSKQYGKDTSIYAGLCHTTHELICIYDLDLNASVSYISKMYDFIKDNKEYDQVCMLSNYKEKEIVKDKIKILNLAYELNVDNNKTYYRIMRRTVVDSIIELTKNYPFTSYSFEVIGFNTNYIKFDNSNIDNTNLNKYIAYSKRPLNVIKSINLILLTIIIILLFASIFKIFKINNIILLLIIFVFNILNIFMINNIFRFLSKEKTYFTIKEKIGFDDKLL